MKKLIGIIAAAMSMCVGCTPDLPTADQIEKTSKSIGVAAGIVANKVKIDSQVRGAIADVMSQVTNIVPKADQSFSDAWTAAAQQIVDKLVKDGKLSDSQAALVSTIVGIAVKALDYEFSVRYPKAKEVTELVTASIRGFTNGFMSTFNADGSMKVAPNDYDKDAYEYLTK